MFQLSLKVSARRESYEEEYNICNLLPATGFAIDYASQSSKQTWLGLVTRWDLLSGL